MGIDIAEAIKAPFGKRMHIGHFILGTILFIIPIVNFFLLGALIKYINNVRIGTEAEFSIYDDIGDSFLVGVKLFAGSILLFVPLILLGVIAGLFSDGSAGSVILVLAISSLIYILYLIFGAALIANFSLDHKIMSMVDFKRALFLIKGYVKGYIMTIVFTIVLGVLFSILQFIPIIGFIAMLILMIPWCMSIYHLSGQFLRENKAVAVLNNVYHFDN